MEPLKPNDPSQLGDWSITGRLGEGEDSVIYLGVRGVAGSEQAAIKLIEDDSFEFESALGKIKNEVDALKQLNNENIVKLLDANYEQGNLWISTEYIHGITLDTKLKQTREPLEELHWFRVAENIFHALEAAHAKGIIHKDVKPSNIILSESGAKLIDFGISHVPQKTRMANPGDFEGSRLFSAPENYNRKNIEEMDVFSAGVTLAYAAKLKSVWAGDNQDAITESIKNDKPDLTGLTPLQEEFIRPLLEKLPIDRPKSANVHKKALEYIEYLVDKEHKSKPVALRVKKSLTRHLRNSWIKWGVPVGLVSAILFASLLAGQSISREVKSWFTNTPSLTIDQLEKVSSCEILVNRGEYKTANVICRELAELGNANNQYFLGVALEELGKNSEAVAWVRKAAEQKSPEALSWMAFDAIRKDEYTTALNWGKQAADLGDLYGIRAVGLSYGYLEQFELAAEWYEKAWELGDAWGLINLGYHYRFDDPSEIEAEKWLKLAASTPSNFKSEGAFDYAEFLRDEGRTASEFCPWYKESADAKYKEDDADAVASFKKYCKSDVVGANSVSSASPKTPAASPSLKTAAASPSPKTPVPASVDSKDQVPTPVDSNKPITSSDSFKVSAPLSSNVQVSNIFGRAFKGALFAWVIPLTNFKEDKVPALTGIQFRLIGYPDADWFEVPYKLKTELKSGTVHAEVDDLLFAVIFKDLKYCPEFRVVREEAGKITQIWSKGQPECANDYNP